ncbi:MAG TPA: phosphoribosylformylglycinamidine synthase, partial [Ectothiorhodospiraceae bacterium]|nr:phosphoribosylformylglycinamidine synthase [Ectothiorhodospiraceae bacterium]
MLILHGATALSDFRLRKLNRQVSDELSKPVTISTQFVHFVQVEQELSDEEMLVLGKILQYGPKSAEADVADEAAKIDVSGVRLLAVPRIGTISPWSTKATDIAHNCGLTSIERLERGIAYYVDGNLSGDELDKVAALVHDRMTEVILKSLDDAERLFEAHEPQ